MPNAERLGVFVFFVFTDGGQKNKFAVESHSSLFSYFFSNAVLIALFQGKITEIKDNFC